MLKYLTNMDYSTNRKVSSPLKSMLAAFDRHLKERDCKYSMTRDREFYRSKLVLEGKVYHLVTYNYYITNNTSKHTVHYIYVKIQSH